MLNVANTYTRLLEIIVCGLVGEKHAVIQTRVFCPSWYWPVGLGIWSVVTKLKSAASQTLIVLSLEEVNKYSDAEVPSSGLDSSPSSVWGFVAGAQSIAWISSTWPTNRCTTSPVLTLTIAMFPLWYPITTRSASFGEQAREKIDCPLIGTCAFFSSECHRHTTILPSVSPIDVTSFYCSLITLNLVVPTWHDQISS